MMMVLLAVVSCASAPAPSCPLLVDYPLTEQQVLADELAHDGPITQKWLDDYIALRHACRSR